MFAPLQARLMMNRDDDDDDDDLDDDHDDDDYEDDNNDDDKGPKYFFHEACSSALYITSRHRNQQKNVHCTCVHLFRNRSTIVQWRKNTEMY